MIFSPVQLINNKDYNISQTRTLPSFNFVIQNLIARQVKLALSTIPQNTPNGFPASLGEQRSLTEFLPTNIEDL
jgi:hypothetical protein